MSRGAEHWRLAEGTARHTCVVRAPVKGRRGAGKRVKTPSKVRATRRITATATCRPRSAGLGRCSHNISRRCSPSTAHPCSHRGVCTPPFYGAAARTFHAALLRQVSTHYFPLCLTVKRLWLFSPTPARMTLGDVTESCPHCLLLCRTCWWSSSSMCPRVEQN